MDAWDTVRFAASAGNFLKFGLQVNHSKGFIIGGLSAGGNLGAMLAQKAKDEGLQPPLTGQYLGWPAIMLHESIVPEIYKHLWFSPVQNADDPTESWEDVMRFMKGMQLDPKSSWWSPLNVAGIDRPQLEALPKAFIQTSGGDNLRDEGLVYARCLKDSGVETLTQCFKGLPHASQIFYPHLESSKRQCGDLARGMAWLLDIGMEDWNSGQANRIMSGIVES